MRTTNSMMFLSVQSRIARVEEMRAKFLDQISSGNRIASPADDPVGLAKVMNYSAEEVRISQFGRNMIDGTAWLTAIDHAMSETVDIFMRVDTLLLQAGNDTLNQDNLNSLAGELETMLESLVGLGNTNNAGSYLFAGHQTRTTPYSLLGEGLGALYQGDDGQRNIEVGVNQELMVNAVGGGYALDGRDIDGFFKQDGLHDADARDAFDLLSRTVEELRSAASRSYQTSSAIDETISAELISGQLSVAVVAADGSGEKVVTISDSLPFSMHAGGATTAEYAANNAWSINERLALAVANGELEEEELVTVSLRTQVAGAAVVDPGAAVTLAAGDLTINGTAIGPMELQEVDGDEVVALANIREIASRINEQSETTGVWATYEGSGFNYHLVLNNLAAGSHALNDPISITATDEATSWTGLGVASMAGVETTVYHAGAADPDPPVNPEDYDSQNAALPGAETTTVYNSNNGRLTFSGGVEFELQEHTSGVLSSSLGLTSNEGTDTHQAMTVLSARLMEVQRYMAHFGGQQATVGARMNRIDRSVQTYEERTINLKTFIAEIKEVDITEAVMNYQMAQNAYEATLAASARIYTTTILDYLS
ncbi:MAG: flagellar hook-associated protein FlgL [Deltaproteobacteria bacterium]|nr:flagellar hook-associated protein FlgL [Candidatus Anaeroferrophillus wilburensis]MBN2889611.1 flagellar hook-associated protein FlgL [Deltaproteobacteria bacterium]